MDLHSFERRICVIKQLHPLIPPRTPSELQRIETLFEQEARVLDELRHRQIPKGLGFRVEKVPA
ncbi:MAG: serine/threonine protein kinase, partial [Nostoc sp.]